ncbi:MAG TPA: SDR family NAD(P)-dependent oxidoreductase [Fibrobacteria bacterium]|nr:SDR family NAD(P)-dependent oxidoreductase [Fibrobacteria bacterium]
MGRTILITGASSGIGMAMAKQFSREGARLVLCARRVDRLLLLAEELRAAHGADVCPLGLDVRDRHQVEHVFRTELPQNFRNIDVLVNNAGLSRGMDPLQKGDVDDWEEMILTNISGLLHVTRQILPTMIARGRGDVINIASTSGHEVYPGGAVYCATKHAVDALTRGLRMDLVDTPLRVIQISPGMVDTEFSLVRFHGDHDRAAGVYSGMTPLSPEDVADAAMFALTRPPHVQVGEIVLWPTSQASSTLVSRHQVLDESVPPDESTWRNYYELKE